VVTLSYAQLEDQETLPPDELPGYTWELTKVSRYYLRDHHGSVIAAVNNAGAQIEGPYTYDSYGNGAPLTGSAFKYVGMRLDLETGLHYDRARYYSPALGRFMQTDPVGYEADLNLYGYAANDPADHPDPSGKLFVLCDFTPGKNNTMNYVCTSFNDGNKNLTVKATIHGKDNSTKSQTKIYDTSAFARFIDSLLYGGIINEVNSDLAAFTGYNHPIFNRPSSNASMITNMMGNGPPLRQLHSEDAMRGNLSGRNYWEKKSTEEIIESLRPGGRDSLKVKADGTIMDGNTRVQILRERGVDVDSLPREPYP
jgi:RHS repeat-associated protein